MRLRGKLITIALVPIALVSFILAFFVAEQTSKALKSEITNALKSAVYLQRDAIASESGDNHYSVDENGTLWNNGTQNISASVDAADTVKKETGIVLTVFYGDTRYMTSVTKDNGERAVGTQAGQKVIDTVLKGNKEYFAENVDVVGKPYYAYYIPLYNSGESAPIGMVFSGIPMANVNSAISTVINGLIIVALAVVAIAVTIVLFVAQSISKRFKVGVDALSEVANGNLKIDVDQKVAAMKDETGDIAKSVETLRDRLTEVVGGIKRKSGDVNDCSEALGSSAQECAGTLEQVEHAVNEIAEGATSQAADTTKATENVITMGQLVEETNDNVIDLNKVANEMETSGNEAHRILKDLEAINEEAKSSIDIIYDQTNTTNESAKKISEAINLITSIAEETNLLSLNASIEAARAGDQGRGFAVVASQISKLAEQSNDSAKKIADIIDSLMTDSEKAVETMNEVKETIRRQNEMVVQTGEAFNNVMDGITRSRERADEISKNMENLNKTREGVVDIVSNLSAIAEENAASTEETSASTTVVSASMQEISANASNLRGIAEELNDAVGVFKI